MSLAAANELVNAGNDLRAHSPKQNVPRRVRIAQEKVGLISKYLKRWLNV